MTFSLRIKQEILENKPLRTRHKLAYAYGLFLFGRSFSAAEVSLHTENEETVHLFQWFTGSLLGRLTALGLGEKRRNGRKIYMVGLANGEDRRRLLEYFGQGEGINRGNLAGQEQLGAFLAGAYLACGNITDPEKGYHLEFVVRDRTVSGDLACMLEETVPGARVSSRRNGQIVYYKEFGPIEDVLTLIGATKSCLALIDIEMLKGIRNQANRAVNCETANIDKTVSAVASQIENIELILQTMGEDQLPEALWQVVHLRLKHPEASLRELAELSPDLISRSGIHHRLEKIGNIAAKIRAGKGGGIDG